MYKECNVVMLATDKKTNIIFNSYRNLLHIWNGNDTPKLKEIKDSIEYRHLYITSDETTKEGEWFIGLDNSSIYRSTKDTEGTHKKIIATTDESLHEIPNSVPGFNFPDKLGLPKLSQQFIELFISKYNTGNPITKVMVEYRHLGGTGSGYVLKLNPYNTINIKTIKDSWSRDEHIADIKRIIQSYQNTNSYGIKDLDKWIEQNL